MYWKSCRCHKCHLFSIWREYRITQPSMFQNCRAEATSRKRGATVLSTVPHTRCHRRRARTRFFLARELTPFDPRQVPIDRSIRAWPMLVLLAIYPCHHPWYIAFPFSREELMERRWLICTWEDKNYPAFQNSKIILRHMHKVLNLNKIKKINYIVCL